jgi:hypothetical protein
MRPETKLRVEDLQVSSFVPHDGEEDVHAAAITGLATCRIQCQSGGGGQICVTRDYGGGETCETGPVYYC